MDAMSMHRSSLPSPVAWPHSSVPLLLLFRWAGAVPPSGLRIARRGAASGGEPAAAWSRVQVCICLCVCVSVCVSMCVCACMCVCVSEGRKGAGQKHFFFFFSLVCSCAHSFSRQPRTLSHPQMDHHSHLFSRPSLLIFSTQPLNPHSLSEPPPLCQAGPGGGATAAPSRATDRPRGELRGKAPQPCAHLGARLLHLLPADRQHGRGRLPEPDAGALPVPQQERQGGEPAALACWARELFQRL
jgi:hypothetical protein